MWFDLQPGDLSFAKDAPYRFDNEIVLPAPPERVFAVLASAETWPGWFKDMVSASYTSSPPPGLGATRVVKLRGLSARERFVAWEPGRRFSFVVEALTLPLCRRVLEDWQLEPAPAGKTRLRWTFYYAPAPAMRLLHPAARLVFGRMLRRTLAGLSAYLTRTRQA